MGCKHGGLGKENNPTGSSSTEETSDSQEYINTIFANGYRPEDDSGGMDRMLHESSMQGSYSAEDEMSARTPRRNNHAMGLRGHGTTYDQGAPTRQRKTLPRTTEPWGDLASTSSIPPPPGFASTHETQRLSDEIIDTAMRLMDLTIQQDRYIRNLENEFTLN